MEFFALFMLFVIVFVWVFVIQLFRDVRVLGKKDEDKVEEPEYKTKPRTERDPSVICSRLTNRDISPGENSIVNATDIEIFPDEEWEEYVFRCAAYLAEQIGPGVEIKLDPEAYIYRCGNTVFANRNAKMLKYKYEDGTITLIGEEDTPPVEVLKEKICQK